MEDAEKAIEAEINKIKLQRIEDSELQKIKNKLESILVFNQMNILEKAMGLATFELMGDAALVNNETERYAAVTANQLQNAANKYIQESNCSTLYYLSKKK